MARTIFADLRAVLAFPLFNRSNAADMGFRELTSHQRALLEVCLTEGLSEDSGYWDYALLFFYDEIVLTYLIAGAGSLTNFGWSERASLAITGVTGTPEPRGVVSSIRSVGTSFLSFGRNLALVSLGLGVFIYPNVCALLSVAAQIAPALQELWS